MVERLRIALLFGGRSAEHDVSVLSAGNVFRALDPARYEVLPIGVTRSGTWLLCSIEGGKFPTAVPQSGPDVALIPGGAGRLAILPETNGAAPDLTRTVDVVFRSCTAPSARTERSKGWPRSPVWLTSAPASWARPRQWIRMSPSD
jgi:D-alanine-D-alanine ligase